MTTPKTARLLLATLALAISLPATLSAEITPPTFRTTSEWLIISGYRADSDATLPWTYAIRRSSIKAITCGTDRSSLPRKPIEATTPEQIDALPAVIHITTDELGTNGANRQYEITGLTNATAPAMLAKLLDAANDPAAIPPTK